MSVCNGLKNRGVNDILIACMDGLKGLPEDQKEFMKDLKNAYRTFTEETAVENL